MVSLTRRFKQYKNSETRLDLLWVETHNHLTAISPFPGAAIKSAEKSATKVLQNWWPIKAGLSAFMVSHLKIDSLKQGWETIMNHPKTSCPLQIA